jgi:excisionase family DNA binding protein
MATDTHEHRYLSVAGVAMRLGISADSVRRKVAAGQLPAVRLGGPGNSMRIPARALEDRLEEYWLDGPEAA